MPATKKKTAKKPAKRKKAVAKKPQTKELAPRAELIDPDDAGGSGIRYVSWRTDAGVRVTEDTALTVSTFVACMRVVAETVAYLPWHVHERRRDGGSDIRADHDTDPLLSRNPNPDMGPMSWRETMVVHGQSWGNGFSEIERGFLGQPIALWPIGPDRLIEVARDRTGRKVYVFWNQHEPDTVLEDRDVFHLHGFGFDGNLGYSIIHLARQSLGLAMATEKHGASFFGNGARPGGLIKHPGKLRDTTRKKFREQWSEVHGGPANAHRVAVLEDGMEWQTISLPNEDAQFLETRQFSVEDICRWCRVPPHKVAHLLRATFSNIEHQSIEFVTDSIMPWTVRLEQEANRKLLGQRRFFTKINLRGILRGDLAAQTQHIKELMDRGVYSINTALEFLDMNPVGPGGDARFVQRNMIPLDQALKEPEPQPAPQQTQPDEDNENEASGNGEFSRRMASVSEKMVKRKARRVREARKSFGEDDKGFNAWLEEFFMEDHCHAKNDA